MLILKKNMKDDIDLWHQNALSEGMGWIFKGASLRNMDLLSFSKLFVKSAVFKDYFTNHTIFSQSPFYVLELFKEEINNISNQIKNREFYEEDIAYWLGYLIGEWHQEKWFDCSLLKEKDLLWLYQNYDVMHTQTVKYVCEIFLEEKNNIS